MELIVHAVFPAILLISTSAANYLPGLLSRKVCGVSLLTDLTPSCNCVNQTYFDSLESLCRHIHEASDCIEEQIKSSKGQSTFLRYVFDKNSFASSMNYLCGVSKDLGDTSECADNDAVFECEVEFLKDLSQNVSDQEEACRITDKLSDCYWNKLKEVRLCPERGKILYTQLAEAFLPAVCTKLDDASKGRECQTFHPKVPMPYSDCVESVLAKANCLARKRKHSLHTEDQYWETVFDLNRFIEYSKFTCLIEKERDRDCFSKNNEARKACSDTFTTTFVFHKAKIENGSKVEPREICSALEAYTKCVVVALEECPIEVTNLNSLICASMPMSCHCPVQLADEKSARYTSVSSTLRSPILLIILYTFSVLLLQ